MIEKRNILITGATGGIGSALAHALAKANTTLFLAGRNTPALAALAETLTMRDAQCVPCTVELEESASLTQLCAKIQTEASHLDWIIHAAGYIDEHESKNPPEHNRIERTFQVNTNAPIYITQMLQDFIAPKGGVISISSTASLWGNPGFPIYAASKGALNTFTLALGKQFDTSEKAAIVICPGGTNTAMRERIAHDSETKQSPEVIATCISEIIEHQSPFVNKDIIIIEDGVARKHLG